MDDKDIIIERLLQEIAELRQQVVSLTQINEKLVADNCLLRERIARLEKNSSNSSKPPSSDIINPKPPTNSGSKRKIGAQAGHPKHSRITVDADKIDKTIIHKLSDNEVKRRGLVELPDTDSVLLQVDLPEKLFDLIDHRVQLYQSPNGKIVKALLPKEVRKAGFFSPRMTALSGYLKSRCHLSYSTLKSYFSEILNLNISRGFLSKICTDKLSLVLQPAYDEIGHFIHNAPVVGSDETGHNNPAYKSAWTWCQQTPQAVYFHNINSRGSQVLFDILGSDYSGVIECDYFSANRKFVRLSGASVQYCWAHIIRDIKFLQTLGFDTLKQWSLDLLNDIDQILRLWRDRNNHPVEHYKRMIEKYRNIFLQKVWHPPNHKQADNIKKRFIDGGESYFLFLEHEGVNPTNNLSEQAIRFVVIDRRITQGTRSNAGMRWSERAWTAVATCARHKRSVYEFFLKALDATYAETLYPSLIPVKL
jgi:hypothetical protein